jgi:hypothetical protein
MMKAQHIFFGLLGSLVILMSHQAIAQSANLEAGPSVAPFTASQVAAALAPIYVQDFEPVVQPSSTSGGLLTEMRTSRTTREARKNAVGISEKVVKALKAEGCTAYHVDANSTPPSSGWLVRGNFQQRVPKGLLSSLSAAIDPPQPPEPKPKPKPKGNAQILVQISDLSRDPRVPVAVFGTADQVKGQGLAAGWNVYMIVAHVAFNEFEDMSSTDRIADKIAAQIVTEIKDYAARSPR